MNGILGWCCPPAALAFVFLWASAQEPRPQFRTGVTVTRVDITVIDRQSRKPITGLTIDDFILEVDGTIHPIVSLSEVAVPGDSRGDKLRLEEAEKDITSNERQSPRIFVLIMNDARGGRDPFQRRTGREIGHRFIDSLGPDDLASVVFVQHNQHAQELTRDRALLRHAVDQYRPTHTDAVCPLQVVLRTQQFLHSLKGYRPAVIFVSSTPPSAKLKCDPPNSELELQDIANAARFAHVPVYTFSAQGLHAPGRGDVVGARFVLGEIEKNADVLRTIATVTGGTATINTNTPAEFVPAVFEELSSYYALAFEQTYPADGRLRRIDVRVKRPDAMVVWSQTVIRATTAADEARVAARGRAAPSGLLEALESPLPSGDVPLRLAALPLAVTGAREQAVAITLGLPPVDTAERFRVRVLVYDGEGIRQVLDRARTVDIARGTNGEATELALRLPLRPGRYNVRVGAERSSDNTAGSVHATIVVPDFARDPLSLSGVAIGRGDGRRIVGRAELDGLLPFAPTAARAFERADQVGALLRVHQPTRRAMDATLEMEILDASGAVVVTASRTIETSVFREGSAEHRHELPLADLAPGEYLLRFSAAAGTARAQRDVRFSVR